MRARLKETCPCCGAPTKGLIASHSGTSFMGGRINGIELAQLEAPWLLGDGNIAWPPSWTQDDRRTWRIMAGVPGAEAPAVEEA